METVRGHDERAVLRLVRKVVEGTYPQQQFIDDLRNYQHRQKENLPYMAPEKTKLFWDDAAIYERAWELLQGNPTVNTVFFHREKAERNFVHIAVGRIRRHNIDMAVVGYDHAIHMHPHLPGYKLERL